MKKVSYSIKNVGIKVNSNIFEDDRLTEKEKWFYLCLEHYQDHRFKNTKELYKTFGYEFSGAKYIKKLQKCGYIKWYPKNPDGKFYVLLK